jgi:hypothetical protein
LYLFFASWSVRQLYESARNKAKLRVFDDGIAGKTVEPTIIVEDIIGEIPDPETNPKLKKVFDKLNKLTGLKLVKDQISYLLNVAQNNYKHEKAGERTDDLPLNRIFVGNPGVVSINNEKLSFTSIIID